MNRSEYGDNEQPCGRVHPVCHECSRIRLAAILKQAKNHEPMVPLRLVEEIGLAVDGLRVDWDTTEGYFIGGKRELCAAIRAAREGAR